MNQKEEYISEEVIEIRKRRERQNPLRGYDPHDHWEMQKEVPNGPNPIREKLENDYKVNTNNISWWMQDSVCEMFQKISDLPENQRELETKQLIADINDGRFTTLAHELGECYRKKLIEKYGMQKDAISKIAWYNLENVLEALDLTKSDPLKTSKIQETIIKNISEGRYSEIYSILSKPTKRVSII